MAGKLIKSAVFIMPGFLNAQGIQQNYGVVKIVLWVFWAVLIVAVVIYFKFHNKQKNEKQDRKTVFFRFLLKGRFLMTSSKKDKGLVLIAAYNEERRIADVVCAAKAYLSVLVVDDGSMDETV